VQKVAVVVHAQAQKVVVEAKNNFELFLKTAGIIKNGTW